LLFLIALTHKPEQCFARKEYSAEGKRWVEEMRKSADNMGIKLHGAYICPNEHTFYFVLVSDNLTAVSEFLGPPMLTHHTGRVSPVITVEEAFELPFVKSQGNKS